MSGRVSKGTRAMEAIHSGRYVAEYGVTVRGPLLVVTGPGGGGRSVTGADAEHWARHIRTALDKSEANALCAAVLRGVS